MLRVFLQGRDDQEIRTRGRRQDRSVGNSTGRGRGRGGGGQGQGGGNKPGAGPGGNCICPKCGHKIPHKVSQRCMDITCPKCGIKMIRE